MLDRFGQTPWRRQWLAGMPEASCPLKAAGCARADLDASFGTAKEEPGEFDACWDAQGVDFDRVDDRLITFDRGRATQKAAFMGERFVADGRADPQGTLFLDFFQTDRDARHEGVKVIDLKGLPCPPTSAGTSSPSPGPNASVRRGRYLMRKARCARPAPEGREGDVRRPAQPPRRPGGRSCRVRRLAPRPDHVARSRVDRRHRRGPDQGAHRAQADAERPGRAAGTGGAADTALWKLLRTAAWPPSGCSRWPTRRGCGCARCSRSIRGGSGLGRSRAVGTAAEPAQAAGREGEAAPWPQPRTGPGAGHPEPA